MQEPDIVEGVRVYDLESWKEFHELVDTVFARASAYMYRGQAHYDWPLLSSLDRLRRKKRKNLAGKNPEYFTCPALTEDQQLNAFKRASRGRFGLSRPPLDDDEWWALGQHSGLATPLLDWTRSPYVALFFAFEQEEALTATECRGIYALSTVMVGNASPKDTSRMRIVSPSDDPISRLSAQGGVLLRTIEGTDVERWVRQEKATEDESVKQPWLTKIKIPNDDRHGCLVHLNKMNINHMSLFPDFGGAAKYVNSLWEPGHEDLIAWEKTTEPATFKPSSRHGS